MNEKDYELNRIISIVVNCCKSSIWSDKSMTREDLLGKSKNENVCMARAILVSSSSMLASPYPPYRACSDAPHKA